MRSLILLNAYEVYEMARTFVKETVVLYVSTFEIDSLQSKYYKNWEGTVAMMISSA